MKSTNPINRVPRAENKVNNPRRDFLFSSMNVALSGTAVAMLAGCSGRVLAGGASDAQVASDIHILNTALGAEREAIAAYGVGAGSGLLEPAVLKVAVTFQGHHKAHRDVLASTVRGLGGEPVEPPASYDFPVSQLNTQADVLKFAAGLERGAVTAYAGAIPKFDNRDLSLAAASILADEAMHWAVLRQALGMEPVPGAFFS
ncbi:ferritin-like protein [Thiogranum longum]|uniref:Ferritin-like protein n=1 Tax=Thiogranum longum TaxID=1537524 RepID=A0A4R1HEF0_9GAMM|nr:ferritin-like domain-containing protein [Thiogranum longum]TCK17709.1 ferritin-like protein [Thiogranum longum]